MGERALTLEDALLFAYGNYKLENYERMLDFTQQALNLMPEHPLALHYKALALRGLGYLREAKQYIQQAIEKEPVEYRHIFLLAIIQWNSGETKEAEENFKKAISHLPNEVTFLIEYATFLIHRGRFEEALDAAYKAKSIDPSAKKLKEIIKSARQKEFLEGIDKLTYEPPIPYKKDSPIPYLKLGMYYLQNSYLSNAQYQFALALKYDPDNIEARKGFATATRLKEGGFYTFAHNFARFLLQPLVMGVVGIILILLALAGWREPFFRMPAIILGCGLVGVIGFFILVGLKPKSPSEYRQILKEWGVENINQLMKKMQEIEAKSKQELEREAILNQVKGLQSYSSFFSLLAMVALVAQIITVNTDTLGMDVATQDAISNVKFLLLLMMIGCIGIAIYFRTRAKIVMEELESKGLSTVSNLAKPPER